jgi:hypothetical protein
MTADRDVRRHAADLRDAMADERGIQRAVTVMQRCLN